ncbi:Alpha-(1,3)-fucosyltransferase 9 [Chamberlinius hualienensis]
MNTLNLCVTVIFITFLHQRPAKSDDNSFDGGWPVRHDIQGDAVIKIGPYSSVKYEASTKLKKSAKILFWSPCYGLNENWKWWFNPKALNDLCPNFHCDYTIDKSQLNSSDAVVFMIYAGNMLTDPSQSDFTSQFPQYRRPDQRWVYFTIEPPNISPKDQSGFNGLFNWTMTYRRDSDVMADYGRVIFNRLPTVEQRKASWERNYANGKSKLAAWYVSHCTTEGHREKYVKELQKYVEIDVYGKCGTHHCEPPRSPECDRKLQSTYKFYMSFENILCKDYVTEKFIRALTYDVVPVVFGGANYSTYAPESSYINALDFKSPQKLAEYLLYLDKNDEEYNKYFDWKRGYGIPVVKRIESWACNLCAKALDPEMPPKIYHDMNDWWNTKSRCTSWTQTAN